MKISFSRFIILILLISLGSPAFVFAQSTSDTQNASEIAALRQLIVILTQELQQLLAARVAHSTAPATTAPQSTDYSSYTPVSLSLYSADASTYLGKHIVVTGMVNTFLPKGGSGGTTNYIQVMNPFDQSEPKLQLEITNDDMYSDAVTSLQDKSNPIYQFVRAYGTGVTSQSFTETTLFGTATIKMPVVSVTRIDKCVHGTMNTMIVNSTLDDNFTCTSWQTIAPASLAVSVPANSSQTFTTPSGAVIDASGNVVQSAPAQAPTQLTAAQQEAQKKSDGESYFVTNKTCAGISDQDAYGYCLSYAYNH